MTAALADVVAEIAANNGGGGGAAAAAVSSPYVTFEHLAYYPLEAEKGRRASHMRFNAALFAHGSKKTGEDDKEDAIDGEVEVDDSNKNAGGFSNDFVKNRPPTMVVMRYFLDRPGYGLHNSAARLWFDAPAICTPQDIMDFLKSQGIAMEGLLVEVYLDRFQSFMLLDACVASQIEWDFSQTNPRDPGILNIRLTDLAQQEEQAGGDMRKSAGRFPTAQPGAAAGATAAQPEMANTVPAGLFAFSMMVALETVAHMGILIPDFVSESFILSRGPYMLFVGGLVLIIVGVTQIYRNNIYGTVAFLCFGAFWFANGTTAILKTYFSNDNSPAADLLDMADPWGSFFRQLLILGFCCGLLKQTFVLNRLSSALIFLLCVNVCVGSVTGWSKAVEWIQLVTGWTTAIFAFYVFLVEFTNQVYHREVYRTYKWSDRHSPEEVFGAAGPAGTLHSKATRLRQANYPNIGSVPAAASDISVHGGSDRGNMERASKQHQH